MTTLTNVLRQCVQTTRWISRRQTVGPAGLKAIFQNQRVDDYSRFVLASFRPEPQQESIAVLTDQLRVLLRQYVNPDTDRFGNGMAYLMGGVFSLRAPTLAEFAKTLLKPATLLGSNRVTDLLLSWERGGPLRYHTCVLLEGVTIDRTVNHPEGLTLIKLPTSSANLPASLPIYSTMTVEGYLGRVVMRIECAMTPSFCSVPDEESQFMKDDVFRVSANMGVDYDAFCESLSLACNHYVGWESSWNDYGDLQLFSDGIGGGRFKVPTRPSAYVVSPDDLETAIGIYRKRKRLRSSESRLTLAISRWLGSKRRRSFADQAIELRIALESLYLRGTEELSFRLATYGAWHLGESYDERCRYFDALRQLYANASRAVHGSAIKDRDHRENLSFAQDICRKSILRRLDEDSEPDFRALALGQGIE